ncbi:MAG: hypothetical protein M1839_008851 [Geoglossum umbratile]|nr:MAG: hypothetical protein M1839_008851 [Geoglossum umbratile]
MGILGLLSKEPAKAEAEQDKDQAGQGRHEWQGMKRRNWNISSITFADRLLLQVNIEGLFKPRNTLRQSLSNFDTQQPARTYGKFAGSKRLRSEAVRGDNVLNTGEPWDLHVDHKPQKRKRRNSELILISDDEAVTNRDTNSVSRREGAPHPRPSSGLGMEPNLAHAMNGDVPEYSDLEKRMKADRRENPCSGGTSATAHGFNPVGIHESLLSPPSQAQSTQVEEISDDDEDDMPPQPPEEPYKGTSFLSKPQVAKRLDGAGSRQALQNVKSTTRKSTYFAPAQIQHPHGRLTGFSMPRNSRDAFKRAEEVDDSPDDLHSAGSIGIRTHLRARDRMMTNGHSRPVHGPRSPLVSPPRTYQPSSDIPTTTFSSSKKKTETLGQASASTGKFKTPQCLCFKLKELICGYTFLSSGAHEYLLKFDYANGDAKVTFECECKEFECAMPLNHLAFPAMKIVKIVYCAAKFQITLSKNGNHDNVVLLEVSDPAQAREFLRHLIKISGPNMVKEKPDDHMEKIFQNSRKQHHAPRSHQEPKPNVELDEDVLRIQNNRGRQRLRGDNERIDSEPTAKRRKSESSDLRASAQQGSTGRLGGADDAKGYHHETRSKTGLEKVAQDAGGWQENQSLGDNRALGRQETEFSKLKSNQKPWDKPLVFPADGPKRTTVDFGDLERLDEGEFLNDNIIAFYLRYLEQDLEFKHASIAKRIYFFNTFFYERLTSRSSGRKGINYEGVQKWTSKIDIFDFDYIVVPVNESAHWYVAIICNLPNLSRSGSLVGQEEREGSLGDLESHDRKSDNPVPVAEPSSRNSSRQSTITDATDLDHGMVEAREQVARITLVQGDVDEAIGLLGPKRITSDSLRKAAGTDDIEDENWPAPDENPPANVDADLRSHAENSITGENLAAVQAKGQQKLIRLKRRPSLRKYNVDAPIIITLDSLGLAHNATARNLKEYLVEEGKSKRQLQVSIADIGAMNSKEIPLQGNFCDCGIYLLIYVEKFLKDPRSFANRILMREMDRNDDWPDLNPSVKRNDLRNLLLRLYEKQNDFRKKEAISKGKYHKEPRQPAHGRKEGPSSSLISRGSRRNEQKHELSETGKEASDAQVTASVKEFSRTSASGGPIDSLIVVGSRPGEEQPELREKGGGAELPAAPELQGGSQGIESLLEGSSLRIHKNPPTEAAASEERARQSLTESMGSGNPPERHLRRTPKARDARNTVLEVAISLRKPRNEVVASPRRGSRGQRPSPGSGGERIVLD